MGAFGILLLCWALTGAAAVLGSIAGNAFGPTGLTIGACIGGVLGVGAAVLLAVRFGWLARAERGGALLGGLVGFAIAAPLAASHLDTPITPILLTALVGVGVLLGAGVARGWQRGAAG